MGSRKRDRLRQRRAAGASLNVAIVTAPSSNGSGVSLVRDVELVKASALYADRIELVSVGAVMIAGAAQLAGGGNRALLALMGSLDEDTLRRLGGGKSMPENWREILAPLSRPEAQQHPAVAELARGWQDALGDAQTGLAQTVEKMLVDSGAEELLPAISTGLVSLSASGFTDDAAADTDEIMENWLDLLRGLLVDKRTRLVLDDQVGSLAASLIREGHIEPHRLALRHAGEAAVGSGLVARLPAFPDAPLDEILDLRSDLAGPLGRYRAAVVGLTDRLHAGPFDDDLPAEMDDLWRTDVQPALDDITEGMHQHGLLHEMARAARDDVKTLVAGGAALYVGFTGLASMTDWVAATAGITASAVGAAAKGHADAAREQGALKRHDLFFLYAVDRRLGRARR
jgi:hypothetical protein